MLGPQALLEYLLPETGHTMEDSIAPFMRDNPRVFFESVLEDPIHPRRQPFYFTHSAPCTCDPLRCLPRWAGGP